MATQRRIRISKRSHDELRKLACSSGLSMRRVLYDAVEVYRRTRIFKQADAV